MKIIVTCKVCGRKLTEAIKPQVSDADLDMYEHTTACDIDGPNSYTYDEDGVLTSSEIHVIAVKVQE